MTAAGRAGALLLGLTACIACTLGGACSKSAPSAGESNTNWLRVCIADADCGDEGLSCVCGACTVACEDDVVCNDGGGGARCSAPPASCGDGAELPTTACLAECTRDADCGELDDAVCRGGFCARRVAAARCPSIEAGVQTPAPVTTTYRRYDAVTDMSWGVVDDRGVYYLDFELALFALPHGADEPVMLRPPSTEDRVMTGIASDESNVYWGEAPRQLIDPGSGPPGPPSWIYSIDKSGGEPVLLMQSDTENLVPIGVTAGRVVVRGNQVWLVPTDGSAPERPAFALPGEWPLFMDGKLYWTVPWEGSNDEVGYDLFRADPLGSVVEEVVRIEGSEYRAGHGFILWWQERTHFDPLVLDQNLVVFDERTGCAQPLPGVGLSVSSQAIADASHAYWQSFNGLAGVSPGDPLDGIPILRADLRRGALEQLVTEGYSNSLTHDTIGQTADAIYLNADGTLVVIDKPE